MPKIKHAVFQFCLGLLCFMITSVVFGQSRTVSGRILGADGSPLTGASITVNGTTTGTQTDASGNFSISVPSGRNALTVSSVGFETQNLSIGTGNSISATLKPATSNLNEVVVTGYGSQRKKDITGSVSVVNVGNFRQVPSGNAEALLQGQASGVTVVNSGAPGGNAAVRIRGITSLGNATPLYVVDGVQSSNGLRDINPDDIESIQVLKDAGSAAIFGIQGSNGVIIVTTKRGRGKPAVSYDAYVGTQRPLGGNVWNIANPTEYAQAIFNMENNTDPTKPHTAQFGQGALPVLPDYVLPEGAMEGNPLTLPSAYNINSNQITKANKTGTDWFHEIFKPALMQSHTLSVSSGSDKSSYLFSLNYLNQDGTLINTYLKRYSVRANTVFNVKNNIRIGENAFMVYRQRPGFTNQNEGNAISFSYRIPEIIPVYDIMGNFAGTHSPHLTNSESPVAVQMRTANNKSNSWSMIGNVFADVDF